MHTSYERVDIIVHTSLLVRRPMPKKEKGFEFTFSELPSLIGVKYTQCVCVCVCIQYIIDLVRARILSIMIQYAS